MDMARILWIRLIHLIPKFRCSFNQLSLMSRKFYDLHERTNNVLNISDDNITSNSCNYLTNFYLFFENFQILVQTQVSTIRRPCE